MTAALIDVVVLEKHGRRQDDVGHDRGLGHELLVHADEQIVARKAALDPFLVGGDRDRVGVLDQERGDRRARPRAHPGRRSRIAPIRDWSSVRIEGSRTSSPSIMVLSQW